MASELRVNTLKDASGANSIATSFVANGSAKVWANFNGTGTPAVNESLNISSLADDGVGKYDVNVSSVFSNANHSPVGSMIGDGSTAYRSYALVASLSANTASKIDVSTVNTGDGIQANTDYTSVNVHGLGDLA
jgi:hypothetical protein